MAKHDGTFTIPERELGKADVEFRVKNDGTVVGRLKVSKGSVVWVPKNATYGYKAAWKELDGLMQEHGSHEKE